MEKHWTMRMQFAKTLLCTTALLLAPALRAQQGDTPQPAGDPPKAEAQDQAKPKQGPADQMDVRRQAAKRMVVDVRHHRHSMAILKRLNEIYGQKNDAGKLEELRGLMSSHNERYERNLKTYREKLGTETFAAIEAAMEVKATPAERKAARERVRDLLGRDKAGAPGRRAAVQGKPAPADDDDGLDAPDDSAGAVKDITPANADAALEKLKKEMAKGDMDKPKDGKPKDGKPKDGKPMADKPAADKPMADKPAADKPAADKPKDAPKAKH
jgi:hypothetical protein